MTARIFVLPTQNDIIDFRLGNRPANILVREFETEAELRAYEDGIESSGDEYDRIENLKIVGSKVTYTRSSDDPEVEPIADTGEVNFDTPAEAEAFYKGLEDSEGLAAPLLIDETDDRFEQLLAWSPASSLTPS